MNQKNDTPLLSIQDLTVKFKTQEELITAVNNVSFDVPMGWKLASEGQGGIVFEHTQHEATIVLVMNQEAKDYALSLCASAFTGSMEEGGLVLREEKEISVAGRLAYKKGLMDKETDSAILVIYFKKSDDGELYIFQATTPKKNMSYAMPDAMKIVRSFKFR